MSQGRSADPQKHTYVLDLESTEEMTRLMHQDRLVTQSMGGVFPEQIDLSNVQRVLDLGCGPGGWALEVAYTYSDIEVVGVDLSERMVTYARTRAEVQHRSNISFGVQNVLQPLEFDNESFDLINARLISGFMHSTMWPTLLAECMRLLRPGGIIRLTEFEWGMTNKPHLERTLHIFNQAMQRAGHNFSPTGLHYGIVSALPRLLQNAGLANVKKMPHIIDLSTDPAAREGYYLDLATVFQGFEAFIKKMPVLPLEEWRDLYQKALAEMHEEDFCCMFLLLTAWGTKPEQSG